MLSWRTAGLAFVFVWFFVGGIGHFLWTDTYAAIVPSWAPYPREVALLTGGTDIAGALAVLWAPTRRIAGYALIIFCVCVAPVHIEMVQHTERYPAVAPALLWARLLFQPVLMWIIWRCVVAPTVPARTVA